MERGIETVFLLLLFITTKFHLAYCRFSCVLQNKTLLFELNQMEIRIRIKNVSDSDFWGDAVVCLLCTPFKTEGKKGCFKYCTFDLKKKRFVNVFTLLVIAYKALYNLVGFCK